MTYRWLRLKPRRTCENDEKSTKMRMAADLLAGPGTLAAVDAAVLSLNRLLAGEGRVRATDTPQSANAEPSVNGLWLRRFSSLAGPGARSLSRRKSWYGGADAGPGDRPAAACLWGSVASNRNGIESPHPTHPVSWANRAVLLADIVESVRLIEQDEVRVISRWLALVTDVDVTPGRNLIASMSTEVIVKDTSIRDVVPGEPLTYRESVRRALAERKASGACPD